MSFLASWHVRRFVSSVRYNAYTYVFVLAMIAQVLCDDAVTRIHTQNRAKRQFWPLAIPTGFKFDLITGQVKPEKPREQLYQENQRTSTPSPPVTTRTSTDDTQPTNGCIVPEQPTGGSFELGPCDGPCKVEPGTRVAIGKFLIYRCNEGYTLQGNSVSTCYNNVWNLPPRCVGICPPLKSHSMDIACKYNGEIVSCKSTTIVPGTKATLSCKNSYKIPLGNDPGYRELTCLDEGIWNRAMFHCIPECGTATSHGIPSIINGFVAKHGSAPWHVSIYRKAKSIGDFEQVCGGTLVSPDLVVSAAHCFHDDTIKQVMSAERFSVAAAKYHRSYDTKEDEDQKVLVKKIDLPEKYLGASRDYADDIALVRLEAPLTLTTLVRPICVDWENTYEREQLQSGNIGKVVGMGRTEEGVPSTELQEIRLPYIPYKNCVAEVPEEFKGFLTGDKFCAGYRNGSSLCDGDSGGGLSFQYNGLWYLRGIVSVSPVNRGICDNYHYTAFTNVGIFLEWIRSFYLSSG